MKHFITLVVSSTMMLAALCIEPCKGPSKPNETNLFHCQPRGLFSGDNPNCLSEVRCPAKMYFNRRTGKCDMMWRDCWLAPEDAICMRNSHREPECAELALDEVSFRACAIVRDTQNCGTQPFERVLSYIVTTNNKTVWLNSLKIVTSMVADQEPVVVIGPSSLKGKTRCSPGLSSALRRESGCTDDPSAQLVAVANPLSNEMFITEAGCRIPILCYGHKKIDVWPYPVKAEPAREDAALFSKCTESTIDANFITSAAQYVEVCGGSDCQRQDVVQKTVSIKRTQAEKLHDTRVTLLVFGELGLISSTDILCPLVGICESLDCYVCWLKFLNIKCWTKVDWIIHLSLLYLSLSVLSLIMTVASPLVSVIWRIIVVVSKLTLCTAGKVMKAAKGGTSKVSKKFYDLEAMEMDNLLPKEEEPRIRPKKETSRDLFLTMKNPRIQGRASSSMMSIMLILLVCIIGTVMPLSCQISSLKEGTFTDCSNLGDVTTCQTKFWSQMELPGSGGSACLSVSQKSDIVARIELTTSAVSYKCNKRTLYYTRDIQHRIEAVRHCPSVGFCTGDVCANVKSGDKLDFMSNDSMKFPGVSACESTPGCAANGCFFCSTSCTAWRWFVTPIDATVYEVFDCPTWEPNVNLYINITSESGSIRKTIGLTNGLPVVEGIYTFRLDVSISTPMPIFSSMFMTDGANVAMVDALPAGQQVKGRLGQLQCRTRKEAIDLTKCKIPPDSCGCRPTEPVTCDCTTTSPLQAMAPSKRLPLSTGVLRLYPERLDVHAELASHATIKVDVTGKGALKIKKAQRSLCTVSISGVKGCYNCLRGAEVDYICKSSTAQKSMLLCATTNITIDCEDNLNIRQSRFLSSYPSVKDSCVALCSPDTKISLDAELEFHGFTQLTNTSRIRVLNSNTTDGISLNWGLGAMWNIGWFRSLTIVSTIIFCCIGLLIGHKLIVQPIINEYRKKRT